MAITYTHPATGETTTKEPWRWVAVYDDGSQLEQFDTAYGTPIFHRFAEIDTKRVAEFMLIHNNFSPIVFQIPEGAKLVHFYRHRTIQELLYDGDGESSLQREWKVKVWVIGFKVSKQYCLAYADESGHVLISNDHETYLNKALPVGV